MDLENLIDLRDEFERVLLQQGKYPSGEAHGDWSEQIKREFKEWISQYPRELVVTQEQIEAYLAK